jgi:hypothetical protein
VATTAKRLTLAAKIDAILKLSVVISVLLASSSVGYYYLVHLPHRHAQFEPEQVLDRLRAAAKNRAEQEQLLFEQQASERRAAEQQTLEERQALEKTNRYEACLSRATDNYNASRLAACNRPREKIIKDRENCIQLGFSEKVCAMAHVVRDASPDCTLPRAVALSLDADVQKARDRCREEDKDGSAVRALLSSTQIRTAGLGRVILEPAEPAAASPSAPVDEVKAYLWSVYQRSPTKMDGHGDFTWKDASAAGRSGLSVEDYVIGGLDPDFRELLFAAGHAMDAAGVGWTILSGFRDDFRQNLASGLKARVNNSFHGGSEATGGYRHGCAVDLASIDRFSDDKVWNWVERKGREFYLFRPLPTADPAHTLPMAGWHELAATLRNQRLGISAEADPAPLGDLVTLEQYLCVRPLPPDPPPAGAQVAETARHGAASWKPNQASRHDANSRGNSAPQKPAGVREQRAQPIRAASKAPRGDKPHNDAAAQKH